jgi:hypothetical protein
LRDRDGLARPLLRRGALRLTLSAHQSAQRLGTEYLRVDPATPDELERVAPRLAIDGHAAPLVEAQDASATRLALPPAPGREEDGPALDDTESRTTRSPR